MTISEVILVISGVINVICLFLIFRSYDNIHTMKIQSEQLHAGMGNMLGRILGLEQALNRIGVGFTEFINTTGTLIEKIDSAQHQHTRFGKMYRTADGKYTGTSLEDLISKIRQDRAEGEYFSDEEIDKLRSLFEDDDDSEEEQ